MPAPRRTASLASLALLSTALLAGCGGGGSTATAPGSTGASGATAAPGGSTQAPAATTAGSATGAPGAGGPGATGVPVTDITKLCDLLGPGDFSSVAIAGAGTATVSSDGPGSAYCAFTASSAAQGGIELDVFVTDDPQGTFTTASGEIPGLHDFLIVGSDQSLGTEGVQGQADKPAAILVRKGKLVFTLAAPAGPFVPAALTALALEVLARGAALAG